MGTLTFCRLFDPNLSVFKELRQFFGGQVGDFQVATSGGFWVAIGDGKIVEL